jgi:hypothetical protein
MIRRPILQKLPLPQGCKKTVMHHDQKVRERSEAPLQSSTFGPRILTMAPSELGWKAYELKSNGLTNHHFLENVSHMCSVLRKCVDRPARAT